MLVLFVKYVFQHNNIFTSTFMYHTAKTKQISIHKRAEQHMPGNTLC